MGKCPERDIRLSANAVFAVQDARSFLGFDVARLVFVGRVSRIPVPRVVDLEVVMPVMIATR